MVQSVAVRLQRAVERRLVLDGLVTYTGDDIAILMSHQHGAGAPEIHRFAWDCFLAATTEAKDAGLYGAVQDLLVDAPSGNVRGAGPAVAEIEFVRNPRSKDRPAEAFLVLAADEWRRQGFLGATIASEAELAYTGIVDTLAQLEVGFYLREEAVAVH